MRAADAALGTLTVMLVVFVGIAVRGTPERPHPRALPDLAPPVAAHVPPTAVPQGAPADSSADRARRIAIAADTRRRIAELGSETYLQELLADGDSTLNRWPDRRTEPLRTWIQPAPGLPDWHADYPVMAASVFDEWIAAGFPMRFLFVRDSGEADLRIVWTQRFAEGAQLGLTAREVSADGWIRSAAIAIATHDSAGRPLPPELVRATARHEVGHALGLNHVPDPASVMHPVAATLSISARDRTTLRMLYLLSPGSVKGP